MTRSIPPSLAPILERLELERPVTVSRMQLETLARESELRTPVNVLIQRLSDRGWLKKTDVRGVWEFIPAERAGPYPAGDPLLTLRATLTADPALPVALALCSALWILDLADRAPDVPEVALPPKTHVPAALRRNYRILRHQVRLSLVRVGRIPVHPPATVLVHLADRPSDVRSWAGVLEVLPDLVSKADEGAISAELNGRAHATHVRLAYLLSGVASDLVARLGIEPGGKVWFGPRGPLRRHNAQWNIADTVLPFSPGDLGPLR